MDTIRNAIKSIVEEAAGRGGVIWVSREAKRLAVRYSGEAASPEIAAALTRESLRNGVGVRIGESMPDTAGDEDPSAAAVVASSSSSLPASRPGRRGSRHR
ncbi:MAG TPA: hypothetical protein VHG92_04525 [Afifellaceae bacterium]|nr:hypothetical protein [Afifellaceae bacterium]